MNLLDGIITIIIITMNLPVSPVLWGNTGHQPKSDFPAIKLLSSYSQAPTHQPLLDLNPIIHRSVRRVRQQISHPSLSPSSPFPLSLDRSGIRIIGIPSPRADPKRLLLQRRRGVVRGAEVDALVDGEEGLCFLGVGG